MEETKGCKNCDNLGVWVGEDELGNMHLCLFLGSITYDTSDGCIDFEKEN